MPSALTSRVPLMLLQLGGYQVLGPTDYVEKRFTGLPSHETLRIRLTYTRVDRLSTGLVWVDGVEAWRRGFNYLESGSMSVCGVVGGHPENNEIQAEIDFAMAHSALNVTVRVGAEGSGGWWGMQAVILSTAVPHPPHPSPPPPLPPPPSPPLPPVAPSPPGQWSPILIDDQWPGARSWSGTSLAVTTCGYPLGTMLGGYNVFGTGAFVEKTVTGLGDHSALRFQFDFFKIDYWKGYELWVFVDGLSHQVHRQVFAVRDGQGGLCGEASFWGQGDDGVFAIDFMASHFRPNATIRITSNIPSGLSGARTGAFWGIQSFRMTAVLEHPPPPSPSGAWTGVSRDRWPDALGWGPPANASLTSTCQGGMGTAVGGYLIFGSGAYIEKTWVGLSDHNALRLQFTFSKIDYWKGYALQVLVDGEISLSRMFEARDGQGALCGEASFWGQGDDGIFEIDATVSHSAPSATVRITTDIPPGLSGSRQMAWWGLNDFRLSTGE